MLDTTCCATPFGYRRLYDLLRREGQLVNRKRVQRIYQEERLMVLAAAAANAL